MPAEEEGAFLVTSIIKQDAPPPVFRRAGETFVHSFGAYLQRGKTSQNIKKTLAIAAPATRRKQPAGGVGDMCELPREATLDTGHGIAW